MRTGQQGDGRRRRHARRIRLQILRSKANHAVSGTQSRWVGFLDRWCGSLNMIIVTGSILARADTFDEVLRLSREHVERSRKEPGCVSHAVHVDCENPLRLFFFEQWADEAALRAHFAVP